MKGDLKSAAPGATFFARCKAAFLTVLESDESWSARGVQDVCAGDEAMRAEVGRLLGEHARGGTPLDRPLPIPLTGAPEGEPVPTSEDPGDEPLREGESMGRYQVAGRLGAGAMGIVYEARQEGTDRLVALKVIRPERMSAGARRRFEAEGRALARLRHPGIAQVYEAGVAKVGERRLPYIALELVRGRPITEALKDSTRADRVRALALVCDAVQHAHLNGVVHRDLKPANVLLADDGDPRVLDFGVSKLTDMDGARTTTAGQIVGTPAYMSPEQLAGADEVIDHRADLYALGVLLYELLAGRRPREPQGTSLLAAVRSLERQAPVSLASIDRSLSGDLDTIARKALEREPGRRYQSASELAEDLRRHLEHRPIAARRPTRRYLADRFVRRNPWPVGLGAAALFALIGGSVGIAIQARAALSARARAEARFDETRSLARTVLFDLHDSIDKLPGSTEARRSIIATAQRYYDSLANDPAADDRLRLEIAEGYLRLGEVLGDSNRANLGDLDAASRNYSVAVVMLERLHAEQPGNAPFALALSRALLRQAAINFDPAEVATYRRAAGLAESLPRAPQVSAHLIECRYRLGLTLWREWGAQPAANVAGLPDLRAATALGNEAALRWPDDRDARFAGAEAHFWLGYALLHAGDPASRGPLEQSIALCDALALEYPPDVEIRQRLGAARMSFAQWHAQWGDRAAATAAAEQGLRIAAELSEADPEDQAAARAILVRYAEAGEVHEKLAHRSDNPRRDLQTALGLYIEHQRLLDAHIARGRLWPWESEYTEDAVEAIARCEAGLESPPAPLP